MFFVSRKSNCQKFRGSKLQGGGGHFKNSGGLGIKGGVENSGREEGDPQSLREALVSLDLGGWQKYGKIRWGHSTGGFIKIKGVGARWGLGIPAKL